MQIHQRRRRECRESEGPFVFRIKSALCLCCVVVQCSVTSSLEHQSTISKPASASRSVQVQTMAISDVVARNLTSMFVALMASFEAYGFFCGNRFSGGYVFILSTALLLLTLLLTLTWDVSRKATYAFHSHDHDHDHEVCKGGICWHGVASPSPASQLRLRLPRQLPLAPL